MKSPLVAAACFALSLSLGNSFAAADNGKQTWSFDIYTEGEDVFWLSPTAVDPDADQYEGHLEITLVEVTVEWQGIPFGPIDVTEDIGEENLSQTGIAEGPAPVVIYNDSIVYPEPPEPTTIALDLVVGLDGDGFGYVEATNIVLGTTVVDLGWPWGEQTVQLTSVRIVGDLTIEPQDLCQPADLNCDGVVDGADLGILLANWGTCDECEECLGDLNDDCQVDGADLGILLANWG